MVQLNISQTKIELHTAPTLTNDLFEPDYSDIPDSEVFLVQKNKMMSAGEKQKLTGWQAQNAQTSGHSFIMPGTIRPFSKKWKTLTSLFDNQLIEIYNELSYIRISLKFCCNVTYHFHSVFLSKNKCAIKTLFSSKTISVILKKDSHYRFRF